MSGGIKDYASIDLCCLGQAGWGRIHDNLRLIFTWVGSGGLWFPVCACAGSLGEHNIGILFVNLGNLLHTYIECAVGGKPRIRLRIGMGRC